MQGKFAYLIVYLPLQKAVMHYYTINSNKIEEPVMLLKDHVYDNYDYNFKKFAEDEGFDYSTVLRWAKEGALWVNGEAYVKYKRKEK